jgi:CBS domain-containing protein
VRISEIFPDIYKSPRGTTYGETPLIIAGTMLHISDVQMLPVESGELAHYHEKEKIKLYPAIGGYSVLDKILVTEPRNYQKLLWRPCKEAIVWIGSADYQDEFESLFRIFEITRFGDSIIDKGPDTHALLTLSDLVGLLRQGVMTSNVTAGEISSKIVSIPKDTPLIEAIRVMFRKRIRRLFVDDPLRDFAFISSRKIISFLFSPEGLQLAKDKPELWLEADVSDIALTGPELVDDNFSTNKISRLMGNDLEDCLVTSTGGRVVTRWDLIMKAHKKVSFKINEERIGKNYSISQKKPHQLNKY